MIRFNGVGLALLGVSDPDAEGTSTATEWFTFLFLPLIPIRRYRVRFHEDLGNGYSFSIVSREKLVISEILKTLFACWLMIPFIAATPTVLALPEVWQKFALPKSWHIPYGVVAIVWAFIVVLKVQSNYYKRRTGPTKSDQ